MAEDVGDSKQVNSKKKRHQLETEQRTEDFKRVIDTAEGRAVLWRILEMCGQFKSSFQGDIHHMLVNEGKRVIGLEICLMFDELKVAGETAHFQMTSEANYRTRKVEGTDA